MNCHSNNEIMGKSEQCFNTILTLSDLIGGHQLPEQDSTTRQIPLTQGKCATVDSADFEWLNQWKWYAIHVKKWNAWYAGRTINSPRPNRRTQRLLMHRVIMSATPEVKVDHRDGDGLNNSRSTNLRFCTNHQNQCNRGPMKNNTSGHKGVTWNKNSNKWQAAIKVHKKSIYLGLFANIADAARAYADAATRLHKEFARTNSVDRLVKARA